MTLNQIFESMEDFDAMPFFSGMKDRARTKIAETLQTLIGEGDIATHGVSFTPEERLAWLVKVVTEDIGKWPDEGLAAIRSIYCQYFKPGDGVEPAIDYNYTESVRPPAPPQAPKPFLPGPGDEPIDTGTLKLIEDAATAKRGK